jgi:hypothetical protein
MSIPVKVPSDKSIWQAGINLNLGCGKESVIFNGKARKMLRQNSSQKPLTETNQTPAERLQEDADIEALRAAYRSVVTASAQSVFAKKTLPEGTKVVSEPILNAYQAAVAAFANSIFEANGLPTNTIDHFHADPLKPQAMHNTNQSILHPTLQSALQALPLKQNHQTAAKVLKITKIAVRKKAKLASIPTPVTQNRILKNRNPLSTKSRIQNVPTAPSPQPALQPLARPQPNTDSRPQQSKVQHANPSFKKAPTSPAQPMTQAIASTSSAATLPYHHSPSTEKTLYSTALPSVQTHDSKDQSCKQPLQSQAMQEALEDAMGPVKQEPTLFSEELDFMDLPPHPETWLVKMFNRPKLAASIIGMCILTCSVYAGIGYWWLSSNLASDAAEPVNMLGLEEAAPSKLQNIKGLQTQNKIVLPKETESTTDITMLAQAKEKTNNTEKLELADIKNSLTEPTGRPNPFDPLLGVNGEMKNNNLDPTKKKDVLADLQFIGYIGDIHSKDKVAMIKLSDPTLGVTKTLIKKAGTSFTVEGERVVLKSISKNFIHLSVAGEKRSLALSPYIELSSNTSTNNANSTTTGSSSAASAVRNGSGETSERLGNLNALSSGNGNTPNPELQEPGH